MNAPSPLPVVAEATQQHEDSQQQEPIQPETSTPLEHDVEAVDAVTWLPCDKYIASGSYDKTVKVWSP